MKKTLLIATLMAGSLWAGNTTVSAQETKTNTPPPALVAQPRLGLESLGLTAEQKAKVEPILLDMRKQMNEVRTNTAVAPVAKRLKVKEIREATAVKLKDILTPEQLEKWQKQTAGPRGLAGPGRPAAPAAPEAPATPKN